MTGRSTGQDGDTNVPDMDVESDGSRVAASLAAPLAALRFVDLPTDAVTALIIDTVVGWASAQGWRVYRRAPSVVPLPPPMSGQHSVVDVACARPTGPPVVVEVDRTDRQRTVDKLLAEAAAGRIAIWVRWGTGPFTAPDPPIHLVTCAVSHQRGLAGQPRLHARVPQRHRPAPAHSHDGVAGGTMAAPLPLPFATGEDPPPECAT